MTSTTPALAAPSSLRLTPAFVIGAALVGLHVVVGLITRFWTPYDPTAMTGGRLAAPSLAHWASTDRLGRDLFTEIMVGARIALAVGVGSRRRTRRPDW